MPVKQWLPPLITALFFSCSSDTEKNEAVQTKLEIDPIQIIPDEIEGCACYLSESDNLFEKGKHLFASSTDSIAFISINSTLERLKMNGLYHQPFTFNDPKIVEYYSNENYGLLINAIFEDSTSYESWTFSGEITVRDRNGNSANSKFVGACGC